jgi:chromosomal replication initiation ATPase DnaA
MLTRLIFDPAAELRRATNQMRQQLILQQHFRRGNAPAARSPASSRRGNCACGTHRLARRSADERDSGSLPYEPDNGQYVAVSSGTGKTHLAIAIARACIRDGARGRFFNVVDLVNRLEAESRSGRQGRLADYMCRKDFVVLDELGYLPFAQSGGQLLFHLISRLL